jgi:hypothetical protein
MIHTHMYIYMYTHINAHMHMQLVAPTYPFKTCFQPTMPCVHVCMCSHKPGLETHIHTDTHVQAKETHVTRGSRPD